MFIGVMDITITIIQLQDRYIIIIIIIIAKTASRNVAFKVAKMRDSIMEDQDDLIVRKPECDEVGSELNAKAALEDVGHNADLYIAIQEDNMQNQEPAQRRSLCNVYVRSDSSVSQRY